MNEITITKENFNEQVIKSGIPVLVDFWATWCGPCRMLAPELEKLAQELDGKVKVGKVNVDEQVGLAVEYKVEVIPTLLLFKNGKVEKKVSGFMKKEEIINTFSLF